MEKTQKVSGSGSKVSQNLFGEKSSVDRDNKNSQTKQFNWLYVAIPGAVLLVVMGIIIAYLLGKKNK